MKSIKEKILFLFNKVRQSCLDYRVTMISVAAATLYGTVWYILDDFTWGADSFMRRFLNCGSDVFRFFVMFVLAVMFVESVLSYEKKNRRITIIRICCFLFSAVISVSFAVVQHIADTNSDIQNSYSMTKSGYVIAEWTPSSVYSVINIWTMRCYIVCILLLMLGIIYFTHRKSNVGFIEYIMHVAVNFCIVSVIYIVLCIGVTLVLTVLELLFLENASILFTVCLILLTGLCYVPACIMSLGNMESNIDDEISRVLMKYVLTSMTACAMAIIYAYFLKILITWEMPSNEIFGIVSGLFCIGMPIWVMDYYYRDDTKYTLFVQRLPYGMIPMIPVQAYAMCVRIYHHGMTPERYMGMALVALEVIVLLIWRFKRDKLERIIIVVCVFTVVSVLCPIVNMYSISNRWQESFLMNYYNKVADGEEISQEEYNRLEGAYRYLRRKPEMKEVVERYDIYADDFVQKLVISDVNTESLTDIESHYIHCCQMVGDINVDGYSRFDMVNQDPRYDTPDYKIETEEPNIDFTRFRFYRRSDGEDKMFEVDISSFADKCFAYKEEYPDASKEEISDAMKPYQKIVIDDDTVLYLNHFEIRYNDGIKDGKDYFKWSTVNISGMVLSR